MVMPISLYVLVFMGTFLALFTIGLVLFVLHMKRWAQKRDELHTHQVAEIKRELANLESQILGTIRDLVRDNRNLINKIANQKTA